MSRRRTLSDDEETLWRSFARSIAPLRRAAKPAKVAAEPAAEPARKARAAPQSRERAAPPAAPSPRLAPLDRRLKQRVARGRDAIDARIDLHGMTQREAHAALLSFLRRAQADDARMALVVTGKGASNTDREMGERGVLRRQVPLWLALPEFRHLVLGFDEAHPSHGGAGALYVRLRRQRR